MSIFAIFDFAANVLAGMDGVGATVALAQDIAHGGDLVGYELPDSADVSGRRLRRELEAAGVTMIGLDYRPECIRFNVPAEQRDIAEAVIMGRYTPRKGNYTAQATAQLAERRARKGR